MSRELHLGIGDAREKLRLAVVELEVEGEHLPDPDGHHTDWQEKGRRWRIRNRLRTAWKHAIAAKDELDALLRELDDQREDEERGRQAS